ncbi:MAG: hypothetical protein QOI77_3318, partial [Blastocatellia bacterium]|nr:hypothetical protein [Blastocatellia bacterium]
YEVHPPHANWHAPLIEDFVEAVLTDREPRVGGGTGRAVALIEEEIYGMSDKLFNPATRKLPVPTKPTH